MTQATVHRLQILGAALLFSTGGAAIKATDLTSWQVASFRSAVAAAAVFLLLPAARRGWNWRVLPVGLTYAATMVLFVVSNKLTTSANAIFLQSTAPLYILLLGPLLLRERIRGRDLGFMAALVAGLLLFFVGGTEAAQATAPNPSAGNIVALASGVSWALTVVGLRWLGSHKDARGDDGTMPSVVAGNVIAFLVCLPMALPASNAGALDWAVVGYLGIFQIGLAYTLLTVGIRHVPALEASMLLLLEPALNPVWAWLVHGESPSTWAIAGGAVILGATVARTLWDARTAPRVAAEAPPD